MKKLTKILSIVLALLMVVSLFAACGGDKGSDDEKKEKEEQKTEKVLTAEEQLLGKWNATIEVEGMDVPLVFTFEKDGVVKAELTEDGYEDFMNSAVEELMEEEGFYDFSDEQMEILFAEMGVADVNELKEMMADLLAYEMPMEDLQAEFNMEGKWELDGDELTIEVDGETLVAETSLSKGEKTMKFADEENDLTIELKKA